MRQGLKFDMFNKLPERVTKEQLELLVEHLRTKGNCLVCTLCKKHFLCGVDENGSPICRGPECGRKGMSLVNYIISSHIHFTINLASHFRRRDKSELISEGLLALTQTVHKAKDKLQDNNIAAYISAHVIYKIRKFIHKQPIIRVPNSSYLRHRQSFKIDKLSISDDIRQYHFELKDQVHEILARIIKTQHEKVIADCMMQGGYNTKDMAEKCGITTARVSQIKNELEMRFIEEWRQ
jgi:RNA polymerase sigma factor (sigma-70 family)